MGEIVNTVRWADNTKELTKNLKDGLDQIEATRASADKMAKSLGGDNLIRAAHNYAAAVEQIGGASKLTEANQLRVNAVVTKAIQQYELLGKTAPSALISLADATKQASGASAGWLPILSNIGNSWAASIAEGMLLRDAIRAVITEVKVLAKALPELALRGAGVADVEDNFKRLTAQAGQLGDALLGSLKKGTHDTVENFTLMKMVNQDLAAGLNLTEQQFGTMAKGAFALAQATGVDVKTALDKMNDALLTGRTRGVAELTGKIDLTKAEEEYAKSLGTSADHLTEDGKLEAARVAILKAVADATARIGDQTDGLDEKVAQLQVTWANFTDDLGKTIATSKVLETGMNGLQDALIQAFGGDQQALIESIATLIEDAEIALIDLGRAGVQTAGFLQKEFYATEKVFGNLIQIIDGVRLSVAYLSRSINNIASATSFGNMSKVFANEADRIDEEIGRLLLSMKQRGEALQSADSNQAAVDKRTDAYVQTLEKLRQKMVEAQKSEVAFVGPLMDTAKAEDAAGAAAGRRTGMLKASKEEVSRQKAELEKFAQALRDVTSREGDLADVISTIDGTVVEGIRYYLQRGASVKDLATVYGVLESQVEAVQSQMKDENAILDATVQHIEAARSATVDAAQAIGKALAGPLNVAKDLAIAMGDVQLAARQLPQIPSIGVLAPDQTKTNAEGKPTGRQFDTSGVGVGESLKKGFTGALDDLPAIITQAFATGGGIMTALRGAASRMGAEIGKSLGLIFGGLGGKIGEALGALVGPLIGKLGDALSVSAGEDVMRRVGKNWGIQITEAMGDQIAADAKNLFKGNRQAAEVFNFKNIFDAGGGINTDNFSKAADKLRDVFVMVETHQFTVAQGAKVIDEAWSDLLAAGTDQFGFIDDKLKDIIALDRRLGTNSKEVAGFLKAQGKAAVDGSNAAIASLSKQIDGFKALKSAMNTDAIAIYKGQVEDLGTVALATFAAAVESGATFSEALQAAGPGLNQLTEAFDALGVSTDNAALKALMLQSTILEKNPALVQAISGLGATFAALSNLGLLNVETFGAMERSGSAMYSKIQGEVAALGGSTRDALLPMQDYLHKAQKAAEDLGIPLDDNTQMLIDQSKELGIWKEAGKSATDKLISGMDTLVKSVERLINKLLGIPDVDFDVTQHNRTVDEGQPGTVDGVPAQNDYLPPGEVPEAAHGGLVTALGGLQHFAKGGEVRETMPDLRGLQHFAQGGRVKDAMPWASMFKPAGPDTQLVWTSPGELIMNEAQEGQIAESLRAGSALANQVSQQSGGTSAESLDSLVARVSGDVVMVCEGEVIGKVSRRSVLNGGKGMREFRIMLNQAGVDLG